MESAAATGLGETTAAEQVAMSCEVAGERRRAFGALDVGSRPIVDDSPCG